MSSRSSTTCPTAKDACSAATLRALCRKLWADGRSPPSTAPTAACQSTSPTPPTAPSLSAPFWSSAPTRYLAIRSSPKGSASSSTAIRISSRYRTPSCRGRSPSIPSSAFRTTTTPTAMPAATRYVSTPSISSIWASTSSFPFTSRAPRSTSGSRLSTFLTRPTTPSPRATTARLQPASASSPRPPLSRPASCSLPERSSSNLNQEVIQHEPQTVHCPRSRVARQPAHPEALGGAGPGDRLARQVLLRSRRRYPHHRQLLRQRQRERSRRQREHSANDPAAHLSTRSHQLAPPRHRTGLPHRRLLPQLPLHRLRLLFQEHHASRQRQGHHRRL